MEYNYSKKSIWKWIVLYVVVGAVAYGAVYYLYFYKKGGYSYNNQDISYDNQTNPNTQNSNSETADWKTYTNTEYGFELKHPEKFTIKEENNQITFKNNNNTIIFSKGKGLLKEAVADLFDRGSLMIRNQALADNKEYHIRASYFTGDAYEKASIFIFVSQKYQPQYMGEKFGVVEFIKVGVDSIISAEEFKKFQETGDNNYDNLITISEKILSTFKFTN